MNAAEHRDMLALRDDLLKALTRAMEDRGKHERLDESYFGVEPEWARHERLAVAKALADHSGLCEVTYETQYEIEQSAAGHVDYAAKYALRLAMAAYGMEWQP